MFCSCLVSLIKSHRRWQFKSHKKFTAANTLEHINMKMLPDKKSPNMTKLSLLLKVEKHPPSSPAMDSSAWLDCRRWPSGGGPLTSGGMVVGDVGHFPDVFMPQSEDAQKFRAGWLFRVVREQQGEGADATSPAPYRRGNEPGHIPAGGGDALCQSRGWGLVSGWRLDSAGGCSGGEHRPGAGT